MFMDKYLLYRNVRLHSETFEAWEVVEYNSKLDPSLAMQVRDYSGEYRKLSLIQWVYVYENKENKTEWGNDQKWGNEWSTEWSGNKRGRKAK